MDKELIKKISEKYEAHCTRIQKCKGCEYNKSDIINCQIAFTAGEMHSYFLHQILKMQDRILELEELNAELESQVEDWTEEAEYYESRYNDSIDICEDALSQEEDM